MFLGVTRDPVPGLFDPGGPQPPTSLDYRTRGPYGSTTYSRSRVGWELVR